MSNKSTTPSTHRFFLAGGYSVLAAGFLLAGVIPYLRGVKAARAAMAENQAAIDSRIAKSQELRNLRAQVNEIKVETQDFARLVPPNQDFGTFLESVANLLSQAGMRDVSYHNSSVTSLGRSERLPIEIRGRCTFAQFHEFLTKLEGLNRLSSVGKLSVEAMSEMNGEVEVQLTLYIYNAKSGT
ncbi:MAG TPA: type 4a pilus biogenesis protein PilO [Phycisphaerae bacterium]|jgi:Tfp pilus assembly protein PilO|nr:type 4a pilus biogenesis protein PilO [Phycisphaerae bacterium]